MRADEARRVSRRRFLKAAAGGAGGVSAAALAACTGAGPVAGTGGPAPGRRELADTVLGALATHRLIALAAADSLQNHYDMLGLLLADPRLPGAVDDIVVEWGNPLYQNTIDAFTAGQPVADADLRAVWRNTAQSPLETWDAPVYEQFYRMIRAVNWPLPASKHIRVLAGDSPIDWAKITAPAELQAVPNRDSFAAALVRGQVLAHRRRALLCYGMTGLWHGTCLTGSIERSTGERVYVIADLVPPAADPGGLARKLSRYRPNSVIPTAGTWLGSFDAGLLVAEAHRTGRVPARSAGGGPHAPRGSPFCGVRLGSLIDAGLYLSQPRDLTATWPDPYIYFDPAYWSELHRRNALSGNPVNLASYRHDHPARYPLATHTPSHRCQ
jgi:hypothetical protein